MPYINPNEELGEQMDMEAARNKLMKAQAHDAYRQCRDAFILINDSIKALREAQTAIHSYADAFGRTIEVTQTLGKIEQAIQANRSWMADNTP